MSATTTTGVVVHLPPEILDRIFDLLPFRVQLSKSLVSRAWNARVARKASLALSCPSYRAEAHLAAIRGTARNYKSFCVQSLRTEQDYQCVQKVLRECKRKFVVQRFYFDCVTCGLLERFVREHYGWFRTVRSLQLQLYDDELVPVNALSTLLHLRELRMLNVTDTNVNWSQVCSRLEFLKILTVDAAWHYNDEALEDLISAVCRCANLTELTLRSNDVANIEGLVDYLVNLERLSLIRMTIRLNKESLTFPRLKYLNFDIGWFVFDKPYLVLHAPHLKSLRIAKKTIHFVKFTEATRPQRLDLFGHTISTTHPCFTSVKQLVLTTCEPANQESVLEELQLFPSADKLVIKLLSKECSIEVPEASHFQRITHLHLNNFKLSMEFFVEIERMKLLEHLTLEECNFFLGSSHRTKADLSHLTSFTVKRVSMPMTIHEFPIALASGQPPIVLVDKIRTHLWRDDHFNVFSSSSCAD